METMSQSPLSIQEDRIAIYGGAYDCITLAHEIAAINVYQTTGMNVWIMPCHRHRFGKHPNPDNARLDMVSLVTDQYDFMETCDFEINHHSDGAMYDTLTILKQLHPNKKFHFIIGMDNANDIQKWYEWERLLTEFPCIVLERKGYEPKADWFLKPPHIYVPMEFNLSSTDIRTAIKEGRNAWAKTQLNHKVWDYIVKHPELYGYKEAT